MKLHTGEVNSDNFIFPTYNLYSSNHEMIVKQKKLYKKLEIRKERAQYQIGL